MAIGWSVPILEKFAKFSTRRRMGKRERFSGKQSKSNPSSDTMEWDQVLEEISIGWERERADEIETETL